MYLIFDRVFIIYPSNLLDSRQQENIYMYSYCKPGYFHDVFMSRFTNKILIRTVFGISDVPVSYKFLFINDLESVQFLYMYLNQVIKLTEIFMSVQI